MSAKRVSTILAKTVASVMIGGVLGYFAATGGNIPTSVPFIQLARYTSIDEQQKQYVRNNYIESVDLTRCFPTYQFPSRRILDL